MLQNWLGDPGASWHETRKPRYEIDPGGVLTAGMAASGPDIVSCPTKSAIAASWVISPVLGGIISALCLGFTKWAVLFREDRITAAKLWVPVLIGIMAAVLPHI